MKVIRPTPMAAAAAEVIEPVKDHVVVIGATAVQIAIGDATAAITPTLDVDMGVVAREAVEASVDSVIRALRGAGLEPSDVAHERGFTWVSDDVKIQLIRDFVPFPKGSVKRLPDRPGIQNFLVGKQAIAFDDTPERLRFWCADPVSLVGLKQCAFGRIDQRGQPVVRDYADAHLLMKHVADEIIELWARSNPTARLHVRRAIDLMQDEHSETVNLGAIELVKLGLADDAASAAADIVRSARQLARGLLD